MKCVHCGKRPARSRLCSICLSDPATTRQYADDLPLPTLALPGTGAKVEVLVARADHSQALHHPDDPKCISDLEKIVGNLRKLGLSVREDTPARSGYQQRERRADLTGAANEDTALESDCDKPSE